MICRILSGLFMAVSIAALICACYLYWTVAPSQPALIIDDPDRMIAGLVVGQESEVQFHIHNPSRQRRRIVGGDPTH